FGLVTIESMACGTPVISFGRGAAPEIIDDGVTGFVVDTETEAAAAIGRLHTLSRGFVRKVFEQRFNSHRMAADYVNIYQKLIHAPGSRIDRVLNGWSRRTGNPLASVPST